VQKLTDKQLGLTDNPPIHDTDSLASDKGEPAPGLPPEYIDIVFDGPPGPEAGRFVEVEDDTGKSISFGKWVERPNGYLALRIKKPK
jgi:hypothetical protein